MDIGRFAEGYRKDDVDLIEQDPRLMKSAGKSLMKGPTKWSRFFGGLTQDYLEGAPIDITAAKTDLIRYASNPVQQSLRHTRAHIQEYAFHYPSLNMWLNNLNFHTINGEMVRYWDRLIDNEHQDAPDELDIAVMQARLSIQALELVAVRQKYLERSRQIGVSSSIDASLVGQITENDAGVVALEAIKNQPPEVRESLVLLPAAFGFDYGASAARSIDYLVIDREAHQVRGLQVSTNKGATQKDRHVPYDDAFVTEIDGVTDLRNFTAHTNSSGQVKKTSLPGFASADFILNNPVVGRISGASKIERLNGHQGRLIEARKVAHESFPATHDPTRIVRIANELGERIMNDLYKK